MYSAEEAGSSSLPQGSDGAKGDESMTNATPAISNVRPPDASQARANSPDQETPEESFRQAEKALIGYFANAMREQRLERERSQHRARLPKVEP
jgi:hypothetical protein